MTIWAFSAILTVRVMIFKCFHFRELGEEFLPCLLISKGKKLLARLIPFLDHESTLLTLRAVSSHLHALMARDTDEVRDL